MPFANHAGVVTGFLKVFGDGRLGTVEAVEYGDAIEMAVFAGEYSGAARGTDGVDGETVVEADAASGKTIEIGRFVDLAAVSADSVSGVVVAHDV